jgi:hypothetical protein
MATASWSAAPSVTPTTFATSRCQVLGSSLLGDRAHVNAAGPLPPGPTVFAASLRHSRPYDARRCQILSGLKLFISSLDLVVTACVFIFSRGKLVDFILDWEDALPEEQLAIAETHAAAADLVICLGTSLQIRPICNLPLKTKRNGGSFAIVNLQRTPKHKQADLVIHARCDAVMRRVMSQVGITVPRFVRKDAFSVRAWLSVQGVGSEHKKVRAAVLWASAQHSLEQPMMCALSNPAGDCKLPYDSYISNGWS